MVNLIEGGAVGGFADCDNCHLDQLLWRHRAADAELEGFVSSRFEFSALRLSKNGNFNCALSPVGQGFGLPNEGRGGR